MKSEPRKAEFELKVSEWSTVLEIKCPHCLGVDLYRDYDVYQDSDNVVTITTHCCRMPCRLEPNEEPK